MISCNGMPVPKQVGKSAFSHQGLNCSIKHLLHNEWLIKHCWPEKCAYGQANFYDVTTLHLLQPRGCHSNSHCTTICDHGQSKRLMDKADFAQRMMVKLLSQSGQSFAST